MKKSVYAILVLLILVGGVVQAAKPQCGDGKCTGRENASSCPQDCAPEPPPPPPPPPPTGDEQLLASAPGEDPGSGYFGEFAVCGSDLNGDGVPEVVVGDPAFNSAGKVHVFSAGVDGSSGVFSLTPQPDYSPVSDAGGSNFGFYVANAGNFNGDAYEDIVVGAPYLNNGKGRHNKRWGKVTVFGGGESDLDPIPLLEIMGDSQEAWMGRSVDGAFDFDGAGCDDIVLGTNGAAYVFAGCAEPDSALIFSCEGLSEGNFGVSVAGGLNVPGCDYQAIVVGDTEAANRAGAVYAFCGQVNGEPMTSCMEEGALIFYAEGDSLGDAEFGYRVAVPGDFDGDGSDEIVIGDRSLDLGADNAGAVYVCSAVGGDCSGANRLVRVLGTEAGESLGSSVSGGFLDGDGFADVVVGASYFLGGEGPGEIRVLFGSDNPASKSFVRQGLSRRYGRAVSGATDFTADGVDDILVGAEFDGPSGTVYLYSYDAYCGDNICGQDDPAFCPSDCQ